MPIDPKKVRYPPECLVEAASIPSVLVGMTTLVSYLVDPFDVTLEDLHVDTDGTADVVIGADGYAEKCRIRNNAIASGYHQPIPAKILASNRISVQAQSLPNMAGGSATIANFYYRFNLTVRKSYVVDKLFNNENLNGDEEDIASNQLGYDLAAYTYLGIAPRHDALTKHPDVYKEFQEVIPLTRSVIAAVGSDKAHSAPNLIGQSISPGYLSRVGVLLGVFIDNPSLITTPNDSYITVDRDDDPDYMKMDLTAMPRNKLVPCYVPFIDKLSVYLESATGSNGYALGIGFIYGLRDMTVLDHMRWGLGYQSNQQKVDAEALIAQYKMWPMVKAGVIG